MSDKTPKPADHNDNAEPLVPFSRLAGFVRQLSHDVRNGLNAIDLEATLIAELSTDPEITGEAKKLRGMVRNVTSQLQALSARFTDVKPSNTIPCPIKDFMEMFRDRVTREFAGRAADISWQDEAENKTVEIDFELLITALSEITRNAIQFRAGAAPIEFRTRTNDAELVFEIHAPSSAVSENSAPETWGREPLVSTRRGGYGLGLFHANRIITAHGGALDTAANPADGTATARVRLPLIAAAS